MSQRRFGNSGLFLLAAGLCLCAGHAALAAPKYHIVALDVLPGGLDSLAFGLNDRGQIVGDSRLDRSTHIGQSRPVVWDTSGQPTELWNDPLLGGSLADINNVGQVVGRYGIGSGTPLPGPGVPYGRGFVWDSTHGLRDLALAPVGNSQAVAINDAGQVVGTSEVLMDVEIHPGDVQQLFIPRAFIWDEAGGIRDIGTLGGIGAFATGVNAAGQVVGYSQTADFKERAFVWDATTGMQELGTLDGGSNRARAINDLGQIVGFESDVGGFIWDKQSGIQPMPLGNPYGINNHGQVVGGGALIWDSLHGTRRLADLISPELSWQLDFAFAIDDAGDITGYGHIDENRRGFLMTPFPEPPSALLAAGMAVITIFLRRTPWGSNISSSLRRL